MNIPLTIPDSSVAAWQRRLDLFNAGSGQEPITLEQLKQLELDEETARHVASHEAALRALMTTMADRIIAAAKGDMSKLAAAVAAGETAALQTLAP